MLATKERIDRLAKTLIKDMGPHLNFLTGHIRYALVAQAILGVVTAQDDDTKIDPVDVHKLHSGVMDAICFLSDNEFYFR